MAQDRLQESLFTPEGDVVTDSESIIADDGGFTFGLDDDYDPDTGVSSEPDVTAEASVEAEVETPAIVETPTIEPPAPSPEFIRLQEEKAAMERANADLQARVRQHEQQMAQQAREQQRQAIAAHEQQVRQQWEAAGYNPSDAQLIAQRERALLEQNLQMQQQVQEAQSAIEFQRGEMTAQREVARRLASQYGVSYDSLVVIDNPTAMETKAQQLQSEKRQSEAQSQQQAELQALREEVAALKRDRIPPQEFNDNTGGGAAVNEDAAIRRLLGYPTS